MALSNEDLLAISQLLDIKLKSSLQAELQPLKDELRDMKQRITSIALHIENTTDKKYSIISRKLCSGCQTVWKSSFRNRGDASGHRNHEKSNYRTQRKVTKISIKTT